jgi:hypothetical protein
MSILVALVPRRLISISDDLAGSLLLVAVTLIGAALAPGTTLMAKPTIKRWKLSRFLACVVLPDLRLVVQDHVQQRVTDFQFSVVFDIAQLAKFIHEKAHA